MKILVKIWHLLILFFVLTLLSCTESGDEYCDPADRPYQKGMIDLLFSVSGQEEITPQTRHGAPTPGTADENSVTTLHVFIFDNMGNLLTREVIIIDAATGTATDARTGEPHPNWFGGARRKLRVNISPGDKTIAVVANWRTDIQHNDNMPSLWSITTLSQLHAVVRRHSDGPLPTNPPVMCGVKYTTIDGSQTDLLVNLERQIARIDFYPAISNQLKKLNVELKITGVKFNKVSGYSYLTYHTNGGTPPEPISPPYNELWDLPDNAYTDTPGDVIDITDPAAPDAVKYATLYIPENIASGEEGATELIIRATYNGKETYYGVKLHNGKSDADKRFWVERNHFYRYNITITGIGSDDMKRPSWGNVQVGVSNDEWVGGESTSPGFGIELPQSEIEVVHFKGITRFELPGDYSVDSNVDWLSAHRIVEGNGENQRTYLEIMTRTNNSGSERMGEVTVLTRNGASSTMKVKQLTEATSLWRNPTDKTTWYRANIGAARIEDPGFFYQWGRNVAYSPYTPIPGIHVSLTDPLVSYGAVNWDETAEIFARDNPITTWDASAPPDSEWAVDKNPCPSGYLVPNSQQMVKLIGGIMFHDPALSVTSGFTQNPGWWFNGKAAITTGEGLFIRQYHAGRTPGTGYLRVEMGTYLQFRDFKGFAHLSSPSEWTVGPNEDPWGMSVRCVRSGNVLYDAGAPDATGTMTDSRFYEVGEEVLPLASTYAREAYRQSGWQVIGSNGNEMVSELPLTGTSFSFPTEGDGDFVTLRAVWENTWKLETPWGEAKYYTPQDLPLDLMTLWGNPTPNDVAATGFYVPTLGVLTTLPVGTRGSYGVEPVGTPLWTIDDKYVLFGAEADPVTWPSRDEQRAHQACWGATWTPAPGIRIRAYAAMGYEEYEQLRIGLRAGTSNGRTEWVHYRSKAKFSQHWPREVYYWKPVRGSSEMDFNWNIYLTRTVGDLPRPFFMEQIYRPGAPGPNPEYIEHFIPRRVKCLGEVNWR